MNNNSVVGLDGQNGEKKIIQSKMTYCNSGVTLSQEEGKNLLQSHKPIVINWSRIDNRGQEKRHAVVYFGYYGGNDPITGASQLLYNVIDNDGDTGRGFESYADPYSASPYFYSLNGAIYTKQETWVSPTTSLYI